VCGPEDLRNFVMHDSFRSCAAEVRTQASRKLELAKSLRAPTIRVAARSAR
jgi:hypothetical protein